MNSPLSKNRNDYHRQWYAKKKKDPSWIIKRRAKARLWEKKAKRKSTPEEMRKRVQDSSARYPDRLSARQQCALAIATGKLVRESCEVCGAVKTDAHHDDYSKPYEVRWLCQKHHAEHHVKMREQARYALLNNGVTK